MITRCPTTTTSTTTRWSTNTEDDTDLPVDVEAAEEAAAVDEEDGIKFTAFNLREERATGYFDEDGGYVERKEEDADDKDAWLQADGAAVVSEAVRKKIEARQKQEQAEDSVRCGVGTKLLLTTPHRLALCRGGSWQTSRLALWLSCSHRKPCPCCSSDLGASVGRAVRG